jgi:hypothetical protein
MLSAVVRLDFIGAIFENQLGLAPEIVGFPHFGGVPKKWHFGYSVLNTCKVFLLLGRNICFPAAS